jgi:hypothetical protein
MFNKKGRIASNFDRVMIHEFRFLDRQRSFINQHLDRAKKEIDSKFDSLGDDDESDAYRDYLIDEHYEICEKIPLLQWYSQFLVSYALFEHNLNELCEIVRNRSKLPVSFKDLNGRGIRRSALYLRKMAGVSSPFETDSWNNSVLLGEVRNVIAHNNGEIDSTRNHGPGLLKKFQVLPGLALKPHFEGSDQFTLIIDNDFLKSAIAKMGGVLTDVANYELYSEEDES